MNIFKRFLMPCLCFATCFLLLECPGEKPPAVVDVFEAKKEVFEEDFIKDIIPEEWGEEIEVEDEFIEKEDFFEEQIEFCPGGDYCPCEKNEDCYSGVCVIGEEERMCAEDCVEEADCEKSGWSCVNLQVGPDIKSVCVYNYPLACKPCKNSKDCVYEFGKEKAECIEFLGQGSFCFYKCKENTECQDGYECIKGYCLPKEGKCECLKKFIGHKTDCYKENEYGKCYYEVECTEEGWTECKAGFGEAEICDGLDNNCDGKVDEGLDGKECFIENQWGKCKGETLCKGGELKCIGKEPKQEICNDLDDDCDNEIDEEAKDCINYYKDNDADGFGNINDFKCLCKIKSPYVVIVGGDCDDEDSSINPKAEEKCNKKDDNCNKKIDEEGAKGCESFYKDKDGDGYGIKKYFKCLCKPEAPYSTKKELEDCNDDEAKINPGAKEECNAIDDNCNGEKDEGFPDLDGDKIADCVDPDKDGDGFVEYKDGKIFDCNDMDKEIYPGAVEKCNAIDDNCNGVNDEGCPPASIKFVISNGGVLSKGENLKIFSSISPQIHGGEAEGENLKLKMGFYPTIK